MSYGVFTLNDTETNGSLPSVSEGWEKVMFSVCSPPGGGGGTPVPDSFQGLWSQVLSGGGGYPCSDWGNTHPGQG